MRHHVARVLPQTPDQMFELVGDVAAYPQFVPWITAMRVREVEPPSPRMSRLEAEASVGFSFLKERFATTVTRDAARREITVSYLSGPFRRLENVWRFQPHPVGCEVVFDIDFEFKSRALQLLLRANFGLAVSRLIACFEGRAQQLYGEPPAGTRTAEA